MTGTSAGLAEEAHTPLRNPAQLSSAISTDATTHAAVPPPTTQAFVVYARTTPCLRPRRDMAGLRRTSQTRPSGARVCPHSTQGKLHVRRPRDGGITHRNWAFLSSAWANVVQDIPNDGTLGTRDWCPRCATFCARGANEDQAGHSSSSSSSQSTSSSISTYRASIRKLGSDFLH
jgi:hypothetical protein